MNNADRLITLNAVVMLIFKPFAFIQKSFRLIIEKHELWNKNTSNYKTRSRCFCWKTDALVDDVSQGRWDKSALLCTASVLSMIATFGWLSVTAHQG